MVWGYTFAYRQRAVAQPNEKGEVTLNVPPQMLDRMGLKVGEEVMVTQTEDGSLTIRKLSTS